MDIENKKTFKILLDSNHGASYTGSSIFNATYYIDLTKLLTNQEDFNIPYLMFCTFKSRADTIANNQITNNEVYFLTIDLYKGYNLYQYNNRSGNTVADCVLHAVLLHAVCDDMLGECAMLSDVMLRYAYTILWVIVLCVE